MATNYTLNSHLFVSLVEFFNEVDKDRDDGMMMKFFLKVGSSKKESEEEYESESDESDYDSDESQYDSDEYEELDKEYEERKRVREKLEKEYQKKLKSWKEGGKEGECVFTPDCKKVSSSSTSTSSLGPSRPLAG